MSELCFIENEDKTIMLNVEQAINDLIRISKSKRNWRKLRIYYMDHDPNFHKIIDLKKYQEEKMKSDKELDKIVKELWEVLRKHHLPMIQNIQVMTKFAEPLRLFEQAILKN